MSVELAQELERSAKREWFEVWKKAVPVTGGLGPGVLTVQRGIKEQPRSNGETNHQIQFGVTFIGYASGYGHSNLGEVALTLEAIAANPNLRLLSEDCGK